MLCQNWEVRWVLVSVLGLDYKSSLMYIYGFGKKICNAQISEVRLGTLVNVGFGLWPQFNLHLRCMRLDGAFPTSEVRLGTWVSVRFGFCSMFNYVWEVGTSMWGMVVLAQHHMPEVIYSCTLIWATHPRFDIIYRSSGMYATVCLFLRINQHTINIKIFSTFTQSMWHNIIMSPFSHSLLQAAVSSRLLFYGWLHRMREV